MKISIIGGSGKMGRWFAGVLLKEGHDVTISGRDPIKLRSAQDELGVRAVSTTEGAKRADLILLSVNIDSFEMVVKDISPYIRPEQIVIDITSIKETPLKIMHCYIKKALILGTHPLFGPGAKDLANQNFVLTPTDECENQLAQKVKHYLEKRKARVSLMTPQEHDQMMAVVLGLSHFISLVAADTLAGIDQLPKLKAIGGSTYRVLTTLVESVISEDPELYATLQMCLPGLPELEEKFRQNTVRWANLVKHRDKQGFVTNMNVLKKQFSTNSSDFGQAYQNMYKVMEWL